MSEPIEILYAALEKAHRYLGDLNVARYRSGSPDQTLNSLTGDCSEALRQTKSAVEAVRRPKYPCVECGDVPAHGDDVMCQKCRAAEPEKPGWGPKIPGMTQTQPGLWVRDESSSIWAPKTGK